MQTLACGRSQATIAAMGFDPITLAAIGTAAAAAGKTTEALGEHAQSRALRKAAAATEQLAAGRADAITATAMENQRREHRNAAMQTARARADAGASNIISGGTAQIRETDLATRLADEINNRTNAALDEASRTRQQGIFDSWNLRQQSRNAHNRMAGSLLEAGAKALQAATGAPGGL